MVRFKPLFLAWEFVNLDQFPVQPDDCFRLQADRGSWHWLRQGVGRRLLDRELMAERFLKQRQSRLLHAHFGPNGVWALHLKRSLRLPLVTTFYGYDLSQASTLATWNKKYRSLFRDGDLFLVEGPHMKARLQELGCPEKKIVLQRIAVPLARLPYRVRLPKKPADNVILLFSGRLIEKKGLLFALAAVREARARFPRLEFRVIGDGPQKADAQRIIAENRMQEYVKLLGFLSYTAYLREMEQGDIFIQPSVRSADGESEGGAPTTILEAQAMGLPVVASDHADIPYVVLAGQSAFLAPERNTAELSAHIVNLAQHQDLWANMSRAGHQFIAERHDIATEVPRLEETYQSLLQ